MPMRSSISRKFAGRLGAMALTLCFLLSGSAPALAQPHGSEATDLGPGQSNLVTLRQALKSGKTKLAVDGDGINTTGVKLQLTNNSTSPIKVVIPANEVLHPNLPGIQTMVITNDIVTEIEPGKIAIISIKTFCASPKSVPPPPQVTDGLNFDVGDLKDPKAWARIAQIIAAADQLETVGAFGKLLLPSEATMKAYVDEELKKEVAKRIADHMLQNPTETEAQATSAVNEHMDSIRLIVQNQVTEREKINRKIELTQLAIWKMLGADSPNPDDKVSPDSITKDFIKGISQAIQRDKTLAASFRGKIDKNGNVIPDEQQKKAIDQ